jgi:beta-1,4-mannosyl-glycoprotein beta-1,4-N-acetylglucosaminyltransferase
MDDHSEVESLYLPHVDPSKIKPDWMEKNLALTPDSADQRKIVDCFIFYNELEMLECRLTVLYDIVDYFVICEAAVTFVGKPKPFFYLENKDRFARFADKIVHVMMTNDNTSWVYNSQIQRGQEWINERTHRNGIARGIEHLEKEGKIGQHKNTPKDDILVICDLDEIPNPELLNWLKKDDFSEVVNLPGGGDHGEELVGKWKDGGANLEMDFYFYNLTCIYLNGKWTKPKVVFFEDFCNRYQKSPETIREHCFNTTLKKGGWHLSYFGDANFIKNKIENFAHQELNVEEFTNTEKIRKRIEDKTDLYDRKNEQFKYVKLEDNDFLPPAGVLLEKWK